VDFERKTRKDRSPIVGTGTTDSLAAAPYLQRRRQSLLPRTNVTRNHEKHEKKQEWSLWSLLKTKMTTSHSSQFEHAQLAIGLFRVIRAFRGSIFFFNGGTSWNQPHRARERPA
jgi:hypothetical protein